MGSFNSLRDYLPTPPRDEDEIVVRPRLHTPDRVSGRNRGGRKALRFAMGTVAIGAVAFGAANYKDIIGYSLETCVKNNVPIESCASLNSVTSITSVAAFPHIAPSNPADNTVKGIVDYVITPPGELAKPDGTTMPTGPIIREDGTIGIGITTEFDSEKLGNVVGKDANGNPVEDPSQISPGNYLSLLAGSADPSHKAACLTDMNEVINRAKARAKSDSAYFPSLSAEMGPENLIAAESIYSIVPHTDTPDDPLIPNVDVYYVDAAFTQQTLLCAPKPAAETVPAPAP